MAYKTDIEIAQETVLLPIGEIAKRAHVGEEYIEQYGKYKAKIDLSLLKDGARRDGKQIYYTLDDDHVKKIIEMGIDHLME